MDRIVSVRLNRAGGFLLTGRTVDGLRRGSIRIDRYVFRTAVCIGGIAHDGIGKKREDLIADGVVLEGAVRFRLEGAVRDGEIGDL